MTLLSTGQPTPGGSRNIWDTLNNDYVRDATGYAPASNSAAGIQEAADAAEADGQQVLMRGTDWTVDETVQFRCHVDARGATVTTENTAIGPVIIVGGGADDSGLNTAWVYNREVHLPHVIQAGRTKGTGTWSGTDVGVAIVKLMASRVAVPYVDNFSTNLVVAGYGNAASLHWGGTAYNTITLGKLYDGKVALDVSAGHSLVGNAHGWANENLFIGGQFRTEDAAEGTAVSGARYIRLTRSASAYPVTNNLFLKPSVENDFPEYHVEFNQAQYNQIVHGRYEPSNPGTTTINMYFSNALDNLIHGGYQAEDINDTAAGGTTNTGNLLITPRIIRPLAVTSPVEIDFVAGTVTFDESVSLYSQAADVLRTDDSFRIPAYPQYIRIGEGYMWDSGTELRKKYGSAPASAADGTAV